MASQENEANRDLNEQNNDSSSSTKSNLNNLFLQSQGKGLLSRRPKSDQIPKDMHKGSSAESFKFNVPLAFDSGSAFVYDNNFFNFSFGSHSFAEDLTSESSVPSAISVSAPPKSGAPSYLNDNNLLFTQEEETTPPTSPNLSTATPSAGTSNADDNTNNSANNNNSLPSISSTTTSTAATSPQTRANATASQKSKLHHSEEYAPEDITLVLPSSLLIADPAENIKKNFTATTITPLDSNNNSSPRSPISNNSYAKNSTNNLLLFHNSIPPHSMSPYSPVSPSAMLPPIHPLSFPISQSRRTSEASLPYSSGSNHSLPSLPHERRGSRRPSTVPIIDNTSNPEYYKRFKTSPKKRGFIRFLQSFFSIRSSLLCVFILHGLLIVIAVWLMMYSTGQNIVSESTQTQENEISSGILSDIRSFIDIGATTLREVQTIIIQNAQFNQTTRRPMRNSPLFFTPPTTPDRYYATKNVSSLIDLENAPSDAWVDWAKVLILLKRIYGNAHGYYFASKHKDLVLLYPKRDYLSYQDPSMSGVVYGTDLTTSTLTLNPSEVSRIIDVPTRPWYTLTAFQVSDTMSDIYFLADRKSGIAASACTSIYAYKYDPNNPGIALSQLGMDRINDFHGVFCMQFDFSLLDEILSSHPSLKVSRPYTFVIDSRGYLIASSVNAATANITAGTAQFIRASSSEHILIQTVAEYLNRMNVTASLIGPSFPCDTPLLVTSGLNVPGIGNFNIRITKMQLASNVVWFTVIAVQQMNFIDVIFSGAAGVATSVIIVILTTIAIYVITSALTIPLSRISDEMRSIASLDFDKKRTSPSSQKSTDVDQDTPNDGKKPRISFVTIARSFISKLAQCFYLSPLYEVRTIKSSMFALQQALISFRKYVPLPVVKKIMSEKKQAQLGLEVMQTTLFFCRIRYFERYYETCPVEKLVVALQKYFSEMTKVIEEHNGTVDKYTDGSIMAIFNIPYDALENHEGKACEAALKCVAKIKELCASEEWKASDLPHLDVKIGINTGMALVGNIGSEERLNFTALGDTVNTGSRIASLNKQFDTHILINESTYAKVKHSFVCDFVSYIRLIGKKNPTSVYQIINTAEHAEAHQQQAASLLLEAHQCLMERKFEDMKQACLQAKALKQQNGLNTKYVEDLITHAKHLQKQDTQKIHDQLHNCLDPYALTTESLSTVMLSK